MAAVDSLGPFLDRLLWQTHRFEPERLKGKIQQESSHASISRRATRCARVASPNSAAIGAGRLVLGVLTAGPAYAPHGRHALGEAGKAAIGAAEAVVIGAPGIVLSLRRAAKRRCGDENCDYDS